MGKGSWLLSRTPFPVPQSRHLHILRLLIVAKPDKHRLPEESIVRDLLISHIAHELRLDPNVIGAFGQCAVLRRLAGRRRTDESLERRADLVQLVTAEAGSRSTAIDQLAVLPGADMQRPEAAARALGSCEADHHEVVDPIGPNFEPISRAAAAIRAVRLLRHDAFEAQLHDLLVQRLTIPLEVLGVPQRAGLRQDLVENLFASDEGEFAQVIAREREEIEYIECCRGFDGGAPGLARTQLRARLELVETRMTGLVEHHQLAVQDYALERKRLHRARDLRK